MSWKFTKIIIKHQDPSQTDIWLILILYSTISSVLILLLFKKLMYLKTLLEEFTNNIVKIMLNIDN